MDRAIIFILLLFFVACSKDSENTETPLPTVKPNEQTSSDTLNQAPDQPPIEQPKEKTSEEIIQEVKSVKVRILGQEYAIEATTEEKYIKEIAAYVDKEMAKIHNNLHSELSSDKIAILAAMNISDELFNARRNAAEIKATAEEEAAEIKALAESKYNVERLEFFKNTSLSIFSILAVIIVIGLSYWLFRMYQWRQKINGNAIMLPEQHYQENDEKLSKLANNFVTMAEYLQGFGQKSEKSDGKNQDRFDDILGQLKSLADQSYKKDKEIKRLKEGYDNIITKKFVNQLLALRDRIEFHKEEDSSKDLKEASDKMLLMLDNLLSNEGVHQLVFNKGQKVREIEGFDIVKLHDTEDENLKGRVIKTTKAGYYLSGLDGEKDIIRNANIECYKE